MGVLFVFGNGDNAMSISVPKDKQPLLNSWWFHVVVVKKLQAKKCEVKLHEDMAEVLGVASPDGTFVID